METETEIETDTLSVLIAIESEKDSQVETETESVIPEGVADDGPVNTILPKCAVERSWRVRSMQTCHLVVLLARVSHLK